MTDATDALPPDFGMPGQPETIPAGVGAAPETPSFTPPEPPAPAAPAATTPTAGIVNIDGRPLTESEIREAMAYKDNYGKWRTKLSSEAAQIHQTQAQINEEYGQWRQLAEGLAGHEDLRDRYLAELNARLGQAAPAAPTGVPAQPQPPGQATAALPPDVQAKLQKIDLLEAEYQERLLQTAEGEWGQAREQWKRDFGSEMPLEAERDMKIILQRNPGLRDLQLAFLTVARPLYQRKWELSRGAQGQAAGTAAQAVAGQMATGGVPGPGGRPQTDLGQISYEDLVRQGRIQAGGSADGEFCRYADFGTRLGTR